MRPQAEAAAGREWRIASSGLIEPPSVQAGSRSVKPSSSAGLDFVRHCPYPSAFNVPRRREADLPLYRRARPRALVGVHLSAPPH